MEHSAEEPVSSSKNHGGPQFQTMDDFIKEGDEREAVLLASKPPPKTQPLGKKQKRVVDIEALTAEARALEAIGDTNWIGKLNEYRSSHPPLEGLTYTENTITESTPRFTCTVTIRETPLTFGGSSVSFGNKKTAKHYASKRAIDWLIGNGFMPADGSVKFPKVPQAEPAKSKATGTASEDKPKTFASQVPDLCTRLGFDMPRYELTKAQESVSLWDGYAYFSGDPRITGKVGQVNNVFGQKKAKEMIAEELLSFLKDIERQRLEFDEIERKRKRSSAGSVHEDLATQAAKIVKSEKPHAADFFN
ncbi:uncharacterized protein BP5553_00590 [Venustampulla echinocandica]|uniref:DRBM domain-containing protein n=1 Tax=Venustampulla echinocandica TaxID=2656787 RepID=A0A370TYM5_9HELO|nr:uncharacterized protein BP5553_00590 [Venustampulla echinocandica]RDL40611.1 hypothetical protein BP5553_00590 [Venustampulla echinocandica]